MSEIEREASSGLQPSESRDTASGENKPQLKGRQSGTDIEFTPWQEEPIPEKIISELGHRRIVKKDNLLQGSPQEIIPQFHLESNPDRETVEVTPIVENEETVGLRLMCSCGTVHEVRFEFGDDS